MFFAISSLFETFMTFYLLEKIFLSTCVFTLVVLGVFSQQKRSCTTWIMTKYRFVSERYRKII